MAADGRLREIREVMEQYYASFEVWGISLTILTNAELFLQEWIGTKKTFFELDFSFDGLFPVADHAGSYGAYPGLRRVVMLALAYAAVCDFDSPIGQFCSTELFPPFDRIDKDNAFLEVADILVIQELRLLAFDAGRISDPKGRSWVGHGFNRRISAPETLTWEQFVEGLTSGNPVVPPPTPIRPLVDELKAQLGCIRQELLQLFGEMDVSNMCKQLPPPLEHFWEDHPASVVAEWARGVTRFEDLDFHSIALSCFADYFPRESMGNEAWRICALALMVSVCELPDSFFDFDLTFLAGSAVKWTEEGIYSLNELHIFQRVYDLRRVAAFKRKSDQYFDWHFYWRQIREALPAH